MSTPSVDPRSHAKNQVVTWSLLFGFSVLISLPSFHHSVQGSPDRPKGLAMENGIVTKASKHSVDETVARLEEMLRTKGIKLFALVDHSGEAKQAGLSMPPTKLLIFGNPKAGTPLMLAAPSIAIDLPLKILVWQDADGKVWLSYNSPGYLAERHRLPANLTGPIAAVDGLVTAAAE
jgi:uncharacterized protein (DUF302 family)